MIFTHVEQFRGECIYQAEVDVHFPQLTVGQTLDFAARARVCWMTNISVNTLLTLRRLPATAYLVLVGMYVLRNTTENAIILIASLDVCGTSTRRCHGQLWS